MSKVSEMTREQWIMSTFPEWGTWLVEDIENEVVQPGNVAMWWLGCTGVWFKTPGGANITIDLWCGNGKRSKQNKYMAKGHQMANMCGGRLLQPNLRATPFVIDPFAVKHVDAVLATHYHQDHMDPNYAAAVLRNVEEIGICELTSQDVVRHPVVQKIVKAYEDYEKRAGKTSGTRKNTSRTGAGRTGARSRRENTNG